MQLLCGRLLGLQRAFLAIDCCFVGLVWWSAALRRVCVNSSALDIPVPQLPVLPIDGANTTPNLCSQMDAKAPPCASEQTVSIGIATKGVRTGRGLLCLFHV